MALCQTKLNLVNDDLITIYGDTSSYKEGGKSTNFHHPMCTKEEIKKSHPASYTSNDWLSVIIISEFLIEIS